VCAEQEDEQPQIESFTGPPDDVQPGFFESFVRPRTYKPSETAGMSSPFDFDGIINGMRRSFQESWPTEEEAAAAAQAEVAAAMSEPDVAGENE